MQCFRSFHTAEWAIEGIEAAYMMRKGEVKRWDGRRLGGVGEVEVSIAVRSSVNFTALFNHENKVTDEKLRELLEEYKVTV